MCSYKEANSKTIDQYFEQYVKDNPDIYGYYVSFAIAWLKSGARKISSKQIIGRIRWELEVETKGSEAICRKINDIYSSRFSRLFISEYPEYSERFEFRELRS